MARYEADVNLQITVIFDDNEELPLRDQAWDAVWNHDFSPFDTDGEVIGEPRLIKDDE